MNFSEVRFNTEIRYGESGGPEFSTDVTIVGSGSESRHANWANSRGHWTVGDDLYNHKQITDLIAFFRGRKGKAGGFRFKNWADWKCNTTQGLFLSIPGNTPHIQMAKGYYSGANTTIRRITKPVSGTVKVYLNGTLMTVQPAIDYTTGVVTLPAGNYTWSGEFDVPARFDTDKFVSNFMGFDDTSRERLFSVSGLSIVELADYSLQAF